LEEKCFEIKSKVEREDYQKFCMSNNKVSIRAMNFVLAIYCMIILDSIVRSVFGIRSMVGYNLLFIIITSCSLFCIVCKFWLRVRINKGYKAYKSNKILQKEEILYISQENVRSVLMDGSGEQCVRWEEFYEVDQTNDWFLLKLAKNRAFIIPKRNIEIERIEELENLIKSSLGNKAFPKKTIFVKMAHYIDKIILSLIAIDIIISLITNLKHIYKF